MRINKALCYAIHFADSGAPDNTKRVMINFCNAEEIVTAKKALWEAADNELIGEYKDRRSSDRRPVNDIVIAIQKLDAINKLPNFVAKRSMIRRAKFSILRG